MTKAQFEAWLIDFQHLCLDIGIRPASRALGIPEERGKKIAQKYKFNISKYRPKYLNGRNADNGQFVSPTALNSPNLPNGIEAKLRIIRQHSDRTRLGFARASTKVAEHMGDMDAPKLITPATSIAADQWGKLSDRVYGWSAERAQAPTVNIANLVMPTDQEREQRDAVHARLDDIARRLRESNPDS